MGVAAKTPKEAVEAFNKVAGPSAPHSYALRPSMQQLTYIFRPEGRSNKGAGSRRWSRKGEILQWSSRRSTRRQDVGLVTNFATRRTQVAHLCDSAEEAEKLAGQMIGSSLITKQTGAGGRICNAVRNVPQMLSRARRN
jgi:hypothetical protein